MRHVLSWLLLILVLAPAGASAAAPVAGAKTAASAVRPAGTTPPADGEIEGVRFVRLKNGLGVLVKEDDRFPLAHVRMLVHAGSAYETPAIAGISHVLEHMVFKGAGDMKPGEAARRIEDVGGSLNAATSFDDTVFHVEVPDTAWKLGMQVVADMTFRPSLLPDQLKSEKEVVLAELKRGEDTPGGMLFQTLQGMVFAGTSYQWPIIGYRDTVRAVTSESLRAYIAPLYQPQNMVLCVVGRVKAADVVAEADRLLGGIQNTTPITPPRPFALVKDGGPRLVVKPGVWNKVHIGLAFPAPDFLSGKMPQLDMLAQILGGDETSRLYREFKYKKGLVDSISVGVSNLERGGILMVAATLDADKLPAFWDQLATALATFDPATITDQEIRRARVNIEAGIFLERETIGGLASKLVRQYAFEGGQQAEANYLAAIAGMDRRQLAASYREFFRPEALSAAILAPRDGKIDKAALLASLKKRWPGKTEAVAGAQKTAQTGPRQIALPGGGVLALSPDHTLPYAAVTFAWTGGDALLKPSEQGLGALSASLLTSGTRTRGNNQIEDFLSDRAAELTASSGTDTFSLRAKFPSRFAPDMLGLLHDMLTAPTFPDAELPRVKRDQISAIKRAEDQPLGLAFRKLPGVLFASAPYDYQRLGDPAAVAGFTTAQARDFWKRQTARPFVLSVCGTFDEAAVTAFARKLAAELGPTQPATRPATPVWRDKARADLSLPGRNQAHLFVVFKTPGRADQDESARLSLLRAALAGQSGLLFRDMRDKQGLGYTVTAFLWQLRQAGFMAFYIGSDPDKLPQAMEGFRKAAANLVAHPLPQAEIDRARNILVGDYYQGRQGVMARSAETAGALVQGFDRDAELKLVERARTLTPEDVRQAAARVLNWDDASVVEVRP